MRRSTAALVGLLAAVAEGATIQAVTSAYGSLAGGTKVVLAGSGFYRNGRDGQTNVYFGNDLCEIEWYNSRDDQLQCWAPAHAAAESVSVRVQVIDMNANAMYASCPSNRCSFQYRWDRTPILQQASLGASAGQRVKNYVSTVGAGDADLYDIRIGGAKCDVDADENPRLTSGTTNVNCTLGWEPEAGRYNTSFQFLDPVNGYGNAMMGRNVQQVDPATGNAYTFTVYPTITGISAGRSGLVGGSEVTIAGYGFSWTARNNVVSLAGVPCTVTSSSNTWIKCIVGAAPASTAGTPAPGVAYPAGAGLRTNVFYNINVPTNDNSDVRMPANQTAVNGHGLQGLIDNQNIWMYTQDNDGFFVPPITANYSFYTRGDDSVAVWLSRDASKANATRVAVTPSYTDTFWSNPAQQISAPVFLTAGQPYWFRARHTQYTWGDWFDVAIRIHTTTAPGYDPTGATPLLGANGATFPGWSTGNGASVASYGTTPSVQRVTVRTAIVREVQTLTIAAAGGDWTVAQMALLGNGATNTIPSGASATTVRNAINGYKGCGSTSVTRTAVNVTAAGAIITAADYASVPAGTPLYPGFSYAITFSCPSWAPLDLLQPTSLSLTPFLGQGSAFLFAARAVTPSVAASGNFRLAVPGTGNSTLIPYSASAAAVANALNAIPGVSVSVAVWNSNYMDGGAWGITFFAPIGRTPLVVPMFNDMESGALLGGTNATITVDEVHAGSNDVFMWPAPTEWFRMAAPLPPVSVVTNGIPAQCDPEAWGGYLAPNTTVGRGNGGASPSLPMVGNAVPCTFIYDDAITPTVTAVTPTTITAGTVVTITGSGFLTPAAASAKRPTPAGSGLLPLPLAALNKVRLNDSSCNVTAVTDTQITCTVAHSAYGTYDLSVEVGLGAGVARTGGPVTVTYPMTVSAVSPLVGSHAGGTLLTLTGTGFKAYEGGNAITVGGRACTVESFSFTQVTCRTPTSAAGTGTSAVAIVANGVTYGTSFTYNAASTPTLLSLAPTKLSTAISGTVNFTVSGAPAGANVSSFAITVGSRKCVVYGVAPIPATSNLLVTCTLLRGPAPPLPHTPVDPVVYVAPFGYASTGVVRLDTSFYVSAMSTAVGSLEGQTVVNITGTGFSPLVWPNEVWFFHVDNFTNEWWEEATILDAGADGSWITATILRVEEWHRSIPKRRTVDDDVVGKLIVKTNNVTAPCVAGLDDCKFTQNMDSTPMFHNHSLVADAASPSGQTIIIEGDNFGTTPNMAVAIGAYACAPLTPIDASHVSCPLPVGTAGMHMIMLSSPLGAGRHHIDCLDGGMFTFPLRLTLLTAATGNTIGGTVVTIIGGGFARDVLSRNVVTFGTSAAAVVAANETHLTVMTPAGTNGAVVNVTVTVNTKDAKTGAVTFTRTAILPRAYTYNSTALPTITAVTPATGGMGTTLRIVGSNLGPADARSTVMIGGAPCAIASWNATMIFCTVGPTPAGVHKVLVGVAGSGYTRHNPGNFMFTSVLSVSSVSPARSSFAGGALMTITGTGFPSSAAGVDGLAINVGPSACAVKASNYSTVVCETAPLLTRDALTDISGVLSPAMIQGAVDTPASAHDMDVGTTTPVGTCTITSDMGVAQQAVVTGISFYPSFKNADAMKWGSFYGSNDAASWTTLAQLTSNVHENWNEVDVSQGAPAATLPGYRYLRFVFRGGAYCTLAEIMYTGFTIAVTDAATGSVPVTVKVSPSQSPLMFVGAVAPVSLTLPTSQAIAYSAAASPIITGISPNNGTALGGTTVVLTGSNLPTATGDVTVTLNGIPCDVIASAATAITCVTRRRASINAPGVVVRALGATGTSTGVAVYDSRRIFWRYLDKWSALTTWKYQEPPVAGDTVIIPRGQSVLLDVSPPELLFMLIQGDLIVDRQDGLSLDATYILVQGGRFEVGTEANPHLNTFTLTLHGDRMLTQEVPEIGAKVLGIMDSTMVDADAGMDMQMMQTMMHQLEQTEGFSKGILDLHGAPRKRTWTLLESTAEAGTDVITLAEDVDWRVGEKIFVTAPGVIYGDGIEVRTITAVLTPRSLRVDTPFAYAHVSEIVAAGQYGHSDIDMRAEAGLMSRNVIVQGDANSHRQYFGSHLAAFHGGALRVENIEIRNCGQAGNLGRYCSHTHMRGDVSDSYIRYNSIHDSSQRACTVHATSNFVVKGNAVYNVMGHTIFVEDGVEEYNVIEENLVARTLPCNFCTDSDNKPANFWMASPTNHWRSNRAAGSTHWGFWFELPGNPHGPSYTPSICPDTKELGSFFNNSAHSNRIGVRIYPHYAPMRVQCDYGSGSSPQYFYNTTVFKNSQGMFHRRVGDVHHVNTKWIANGDGYFWKQFPTSEITPSWLPNVETGLFMCNTDGSPCGSRAITMPQNEHWMMRDVTFVNYGNSGVIAGCANCDDDVFMAQGAFTYRMAGLKFINSRVRTYWNEPKKCIYWDLDGTLTGFVNGSATPYYAWNNWPECPRDMTGTYAGASVCNGQAMPRRVQIDWFSPTELQFISMNVTSDAGTGLMRFRPMEIYGWVVPMVNYHTGYHLRFHGTLIDWRRLRVRYSEPEYINGIAGTRAALLGGGRTAATESEWTGLKFSWIDTRWRNMVLYGDGQNERPNLAPGLLPAPGDDFGTGTMPDRTNRTWEVIMTNNNITATASRAGKYMFSVWNIQCAPWECGTPAPGPLGNTTNWSDPATWAGLYASRPGRIPGPGDDVTINATMNVILDVTTPILGKLTVIGRLSFKDSAARGLHAASIVNWGFFEIGTPSAPFVNPAEVVLYGNRYSPTVLVDNNLFLSNKVFVNLGTVSMVGARRPTVWTRLASTANPGDNVITLTSSVQGAWFPGDEVVITSTEFDHAQYETVKVAAVNGVQVTLTAPLANRHYSGPASNSGVGASTFLRAAAGVLTRNVVFRGNTTDANDRYGASMVVSKVTRPNAAAGRPDVWQGVVDMRYVQFKSTGKQLTEHASILFQYGNFLFDTSVPATNPYNYLEGITFSTSYNYGIVATAAKHVVVNASIFHENYRNGFTGDIDSTNITVVNSLFVGNLRSPDVNAPDQMPWYRFQGALVLYAVPGRMSGNLVSGAIDTGFTYRVPDCRADHERLYSNNEAHGVRIGAWLLSTYSASGCVRVNKFTAWKAAHHGIMTVDQVSDVVITNSVVSDNHIGISLSYDKSGPRVTQSNVTDTRIFGSTLATVGCTQSKVCRAVNKQDVTGDNCNSVFGPTVRRIGWVLPQNMNHGKTCERDEDQQMPVCDPLNQIVRMCGLPLEKRYGTIRNANNAVAFNRVTFGYFNETDCGARSTAIAHNPTQIDQAVPHYMRGITWEATPLGARFSFRTNGYTDEKCQDDVGCDGINMIFLQDQDGSLTGSRPGAVVLGPNPAHTYPSPHCTTRTPWNGFECAGETYQTVTTQQVVDGVTVTNVIPGGTRPQLRYAQYTLANGVGQSRIAYGGVQYTRQLDVSDNKTWTTAVTFGEPVMDTCAMRMPGSDRAMVLALNSTTYVAQFATEPDFARFRFFSTDPSEAVIVKLFLSRPHGREMRVNGRLVPMIDPPDNTVILPKLTDPAGTWIYNPADRALWFTMRGTPEGSNTVFEVATLPSVQVNLHLATTVEEFFSDHLSDTINALSLALGIPRWRIKIVDVRPGSVAITISIAAASPANSTTTLVDTPASGNGSTVSTTSPEQAALYAAQLAEVTAIAARLQQASVAEAVSAQLGVPVLALSAAISDPYATDNGGNVDVNGGSGSAGLSPGIIAAIVIGSIFGLVFILGGLLRATNVLGPARAPLSSAQPAQPKQLDATPIYIGHSPPQVSPNGTTSSVNPVRTAGATDSSISSRLVHNRQTSVRHGFSPMQQAHAVGARV